MKRTTTPVDARQGLLFGGDTAQDAAPVPLPVATHTVAPASTAPAATAAPGATKGRVRPPIDGAYPFVHEPAFDRFTPHAFLHPKGERRTQLNGHVVEYAFTRARRRSIGMQVGPEGLSVRAPKWVALHEVDAALQERASWIVKHLKDQQARVASDLARRVEWRDGTTITYLGEPVVVVLDDCMTGVLLAEPCSDAAQATLGGVPQRLLRVGLRSDASASAIRDTVHAWLQRQALETFESRCAHFAAKLGVKVTRLSLSAARTRWGSAGADGAVRLNWRLVHYDMACIDYVVVHELSHLRHMNHSPAFWRVVESAMPDYERAKLVLRAQALDRHD